MNYQLRQNSQVCRASMPVLTFARYILELSLMEYDLNVETSESMLATAVMYIALKVGTKETRVFILLLYTVANAFSEKLSKES